MKKILSILLFFPLFMSCKTNEEKIQDLIREQMFQTLYDYQSYEPIETSNIVEEIHSLENDSTIITFVKEYTKGEEKIGYATTEFKDEMQEILDNVLDRRINYLSYTNELNKPYGYSLIHKFRAKNKGGLYNIYTKKYLIDKDYKRIIWEYNIDEIDKVKRNATYIINRWNESKLWKQKNIDFLEENKKKDGVITTESGLQYKILKQGKGIIPNKKSTVSVHYRAKLIDGNEFDNSYGRKYTLKYEAGKAMGLKGISEALTTMPIGSKWEVYIPQELGFGASTGHYGNIKPYSTLIYELHLLGVE